VYQQFVSLFDFIAQQVKIAVIVYVRQQYVFAERFTSRAVERPWDKNTLSIAQIAAGEGKEQEQDGAHCLVDWLVIIEKVDLWGWRWKDTMDRNWKTPANRVVLDAKMNILGRLWISNITRYSLSIDQKPIHCYLPRDRFVFFFRSR